MQECGSEAEKKSSPPALELPLPAPQEFADPSTLQNGNAVAKRDSQVQGDVVSLVCFTTVGSLIIAFVHLCLTSTGSLSIALLHLCFTNVGSLSIALFCSIALDNKRLSAGGALKACGPSVV